MADTPLKRDPNFQPVMGAVTNDTSKYVQPLLVDPVTGRLLVDVGSITVTSSGSDGAILDGVTNTIKATVLDYTNSNPLAVRLTDTNGDYIAAGAGTQYTEDDAAAANPVGTALNLIRQDTLSSTTVSADGDNIAARATAKGEMYVKHTDAIPVTDNGGTLSIDDGGGSITVDGSVTADTELPAAAALADAASNPTTPTAGAANLMYNGSTWDRVRGDTTNGLWVNIKSAVTLTVSVSGTVTVDSELPAAAALSDAFSNPTAPGVGAFLMGYNSTSWERIRTDIGDGSSSTGLLNVVNMWYNGSTYDRMRGDTTNGLWVNVKNSASLPAGSNTIGGVNVVPATSGGLLINRVIAAASTNATSVKASAGQVYGWFIFNTSAATKFVKLYNKATAPTVGTDTPVMTIPVPAGGGANVEFTNGIAFGTGIALAMTGAVGDSDTTALSANDVVCNLLYK